MQRDRRRRKGMKCFLGGPTIFGWDMTFGIDLENS